MTNPFAAMAGSLIAVLGAPSVVTLLRKGAGAYVDGRWVPTVDTSTNIDAVVNPTSLKTQQLLENERTTDAITVYTSELLHSSSVVGAENADVLVYQGRSYKVLTVENWNTQAGFCKAIAVRLGE